MFSFGTYFLCALTAWNLWNGSLAKDHHSGYVCLLDDPNPNACDSLCLTALRPMLNEINTQVNSLVDQQAKAEAKHQERQTKMEAQIQKIQTKMEAQFQAIQTKVEAQFQAIQTKMEAQFQKIQTKVEAPIQEGQDTIEGRSLEMLSVPTGLARFEKLKGSIIQSGSRYFFIVELSQKYNEAAHTCMQMGASLVKFEINDDLTELHEKLKGYTSAFWLGKFSGPTGMCAIINSRGWRSTSCENSFYFICQLGTKLQY